MSNFNQPFEDLQHLAQRVAEGDNFEVDLEIFTRFAEDVRQWVLENTRSRKVQEIARTMPQVERKKKKGSIWNALGASGINMYKRHQEREEVRSQVLEIARRFRALHRLAADEWDELVD